MGIGSCSTRLILEEHKRPPFCGKALQLGRQDIRINAEEFRNLAKEHQVSLFPTRLTETLRPNIREIPTLDDLPYFTALGFDSVESIDASAFEKAEIIWDLNYPIPEKHHSTCDLVYDGGTLEHIYNVPGALENIFHLLKPGGRVIHHAPSNNCVDHGFYNFSPTFFYDYYTTNQFKIETIYYIEIETDFFKPINVFEYLPGYLELSSCGLFDPGKVGLTFVVARKTEKSTGNKYPTQSHYQEAWPELASSKQKKDHPPFFHDKYQRLMPRPIHLHPRLPPPPILPADGWIPDITRALFIEEQLLELPVKGLKTLSFRILFTILKRKFCALFIWPSPGESDAKIAAGKLLHGPRSELASVSFFILLKIFIRKLRLSILGRAK